MRWKDKYLKTFAGVIEKKIKKYKVTQKYEGYFQCLKNFGERKFCAFLSLIYEENNKNIK